MELKLEHRHNAEVPTTAANRPKKVRILRPTGAHPLALSSDKFRRYEVVHSHPVLAGQPAEAAAESETGNAGG